MATRGREGEENRPTWLALALCLLLTTAATAFVGYSERQAEAARLASATRAARDRVETRMAVYVAMLRGCAGLFSRSDRVSPSDFHLFVERLRLPTFYAGTLGIGYSARYRGVSVAEATARARAESGRDIHIWPDAPRDEIHAILHLEPLDHRNRVALGFDMYTEPVRREAMTRARDVGESALSGMITLVQEVDEHKQAGFTLYVPVFDGGAVPDTVEERREKLKGYAYAPLRTKDLFDALLADDSGALALAIYDGDGTSEDAKLYALGRTFGPSDDGVATERIPIGGRIWTARFARAEPGPMTPLTPIVALLGVGLSVVVFLITRSRDAARVREIRANQEVLRFTQMFVGVLGHDLRSPLSAITLSARLLLEQGDERAKKALSRIVTSSERMARMIDQILDFTRSRLGGGIPIVAQPMDLGALVRDVADEIATAGEPCAIDLDARGELGGSWDGDRLAQVFSNLLRNAMEHRSHSPVRVRLSGEDSEVVTASVENDEPIPPSLVPVAFEPFHGTARRSGSRGGLGLGLYITREIVAAHRGTIRLESHKESGTKFTVTLPRRVVFA